MESAPGPVERAVVMVMGIFRTDGSVTGLDGAAATPALLSNAASQQVRSRVHSLSSAAVASGPSLQGSA